MNSTISELLKKYIIYMPGFLETLSKAGQKVGADFLVEFQTQPQTQPSMADKTWRGHPSSYVHAWR